MKFHTVLFALILIGDEEIVAADPEWWVAEGEN